MGERTARRASEFGAKADCLGENVDAFLERVKDIQGPAIHLRGKHSRGELASRARRQGIEMAEQVVYDQVRQDLSAEAQQVLWRGIAVVPVFSPRTAGLVSKYDVGFGTIVIAISEATAEAWNGPGVIRIAHRPDATAMSKMVAEVF